MKFALCISAFCVRLYSVVRHEAVIHEFDPYFNLRATKLLSREGLISFMNWFDDRAWYPLGRAVGSTVFPGVWLCLLVSCLSPFARGLHAHLLSRVFCRANGCCFNGFVSVTCVDNDSEHPDCLRVFGAKHLRSYCIGGVLHGKRGASCVFI